MRARGSGGRSAPERRDRARHRRLGGADLDEARSVEAPVGSRGVGPPEPVHHRRRVHRRDARRGGREHCVRIVDQATDASARAGAPSHPGSAPGRQRVHVGAAVGPHRATASPRTASSRSRSTSPMQVASAVTWLVGAWSRRAMAPFAVLACLRAARAERCPPHRPPRRRRSCRRRRRSACRCSVTRAPTARVAQGRIANAALDDRMQVGRASTASCRVDLRTSKAGSTRPGWTSPTSVVHRDGARTDSLRDDRAVQAARSPRPSTLWPSHPLCRRG